MRKKKDFLAALLAILLLASLMAAGLNIWYDRRYEECLSSADAMYFLMSDLEAEANRGGAPAVEAFDFGAYDLWDDWDANFNAVLLDEDGNILARTGTLACAEQTALNMILARCERWIETPQSDGTAVRGGEYGRLGLLLDASGEIAARFIAHCEKDGAQLRTRSVPVSTYTKYFPDIDREFYARMTGDGYTPDGALSDGEGSVEATEAYVRWENEELAQAGELRAEIRPLSGAFSGRVLAAFYLDNAELRERDAARNQYHTQATEAVTAALIFYAAFSLLLAVWVFRDARRRDFLPAMWGLLTLIGNVVAWLVYMLVRSRGMGSRCPRCGTALRGEFAYCPACGLQVHRACASCGRAAKDGWKICPYCGTELPESPGTNANGEAPEEKTTL